MRNIKSWTTGLLITLAWLSSLHCPVDGAPLERRDGLQVQISLASNVSSSSTLGHVSLMFAPAGTDPLEDYDVTSTPNRLYGKNTFEFPVTLSRTDPADTDTDVWGFARMGPSSNDSVTLTGLPAGRYSVQAFLNQYENVTRSDGSQVSVRFPCGDGAPPVAGYGTLKTTIANFSVTGSPQTINLAFSQRVPVSSGFNGTETGGCHQGNYADTTLLKHVKIQSTALSEFWGRPMYVGANVLLPVSNSLLCFCQHS